jgi:hypothetical protein
MSRAAAAILLLAAAEQEYVATKPINLNKAAS